MDEAAQVMGISPRQIKRLQARYRRDRPAALVHGNRARSPCQAVSAAHEAQVLELEKAGLPGSITSI